MNGRRPKRRSVRRRRNGKRPRSERKRGSGRKSAKGRGRGKRSMSTAIAPAIAHTRRPRSTRDQDQ